jgi:hypothetical protein
MYRKVCQLSLQRETLFYLRLTAYLQRFLPPTPSFPPHSRPYAGYPPQASFGALVRVEKKRERELWCGNACEQGGGPSNCVQEMSNRQARELVDGSGLRRKNC